MTINEIKDKRNGLLHQAQEILLANPDAEKRASAQKMLVDADALEADVVALEKIEKIQTEERSRTAPARPVPGASAAGEGADAERRAFENYIKTGEVRTVVGMTTGASNGGQFVPQSFYPVLQEALKSYGSVLNVVKAIETADGSPMKYATANDTGNLLSLMTEDNSTAVSEADPTLSGGTISSDWFSTGVIKVSLPELRDSAFDIDAFIRNNFGKRYYRGLSQWVTAGNSSNVASIVTGATLGATQGDPTAVIKWSDVVALYAALDPAYEADARFAMNAATRGVMLGIVDTLGRPLYIPSPNADGFDTILGKPVVINPYMDNSTQAGTDKYPLMYGDFSAYLFRTVRPGLEIVRLNERYMDTGSVGFIGFGRAGGLVIDAGTHPLLKYKVAHS